jgi:hypothetical protein
VTTIRHQGHDLIVDADDWNELAYQVASGRVQIRTRNNGQVEFILAPREEK